MPPGLEVADIFRRHGPAYVHAHDGHLGRVERRVMSAIELCRTAALGGHVEGCRTCGTMRVAYNSCRNRHCPKCQGAVARDWLEARAGDLLPVPYFHVVFTLAGRDRVHSLPEQAGRLRHPVPNSRRDAAHHCRRSQTSRCRDRPHRSAAQLGPDPELSSPAMDPTAHDSAPTIHQFVLAVVTQDQRQSHNLHSARHLAGSFNLASMRFARRAAASSTFSPRTSQNPPDSQIGCDVIPCP